MKLTLATAVACAALAVAGCGDDSKKSSKDTGGPVAQENNSPTQPSTGGGAKEGAGGGSDLQISADESGQLKFDKDSLDAKAGKVTIVMDNPSSVPHAVAVEGNGVDKDGETVGNGGKSTVSVDLKAGTYTFYCPVDGHEDAGMKGTLTVK
jgi:plastocyanin